MSMELSNLRHVIRLTPCASIAVENATHQFVVFFEPNPNPSLARDAVNLGLLSLETTLLHHPVESATLGGFLALIFTPALVSVTKFLHRHFLGGVYDAAVSQELPEKIIMTKQFFGGSFDRFWDL
jgi:hypothetical protein